MCDRILMNMESVKNSIGFNFEKKMFLLFGLLYVHLILSRSFIFSSIEFNLVKVIRLTLITVLSYTNYMHML